MDKVVIKNTDKRFGVFAQKDIAEQEVIFLIKGKLVNVPNSHTIQVEVNQHIDPIAIDPKDVDSQWCFANHHCAPNSYVDTQQLKMIAKKNIKTGEEIHFNYNTTEYDMASPFICTCGSENCEREIKGFRYLSEADQEQLYPEIAPHLQAIVLNKNKKKDPIH